MIGTDELPRWRWWLKRLAAALAVAALLTIYQLHARAGRMSEEAAELEIDRQLGLTVEPLDEDVAADLDVPRDGTGLVVTSLADGRAADRAKIRAGDVIEQVGTFAITDAESAADALRSQGQGPVALLVNRHGHEMRIELRRDLSQPASLSAAPGLGEQR